MVETLYKTKNRFAEIEVVRKNDILFLVLDGFTNCVVNLKTKIHTEYAEFMKLLPYLNPQGKRALMIGLGIGSVSEVLKRYRIKTDVIEINPSMRYVASKFFGYRPTGKIYIGRAEDYLEKIYSHYDYFIMDACEKGRSPRNLISCWLCQAGHRLLIDDGIFVLSTVYDLQDKTNTLLKGSCIKKTIESVFKSQLSFCMSPKGKEDSTDVGIFLGFKTQDQRRLPFWAEDKIFNIDIVQGSQVLDKNSNIIEEAETQISKAWREDTEKDMR